MLKHFTLPRNPMTLCCLIRERLGVTGRRGWSWALQLSKAPLHCAVSHHTPLLRGDGWLKNGLATKQTAWVSGREINTRMIKWHKGTCYLFIKMMWRDGLCSGNFNRKTCFVTRNTHLNFPVRALMLTFVIPLPPTSCLWPWIMQGSSLFGEGKAFMFCTSG